METLAPAHKAIADHLTGQLMGEPTTGYTEKLLILTSMKQAIIQKMQDERAEYIKNTERLSQLIDSHR